MILMKGLDEFLCLEFFAAGKGAGSLSRDGGATVTSSCAHGSPLPVLFNPALLSTTNTKEAK